KPSKQRCILCRGQHASDSVLCPVIRQVREKIGIHFSRREKVVILKKEKKNEIHNEKKPEQQQKKEQERKKNKSKKRTKKNFRDRDRQVQRNNRNQKKKEDEDEVSQLRAQIAQLQETVKHLSTMVHALSHLLRKQDYYEEEEETQTSDVEYEEWTICPTAGAESPRSSTTHLSPSGVFQVGDKEIKIKDSRISTINSGVKQEEQVSYVVKICMPNDELD
ncbi:hypothetical protein RFI_38112, partial [Reticulomyxa filosa]